MFHIILNMNIMGFQQLELGFPPAIHQPLIASLSAIDDVHKALGNLMINLTGGTRC